MACTRSGKGRDTALLFFKRSCTQRLMESEHGQKNLLMVGEHTGVVGVGYCN